MSMGSSAGRSRNHPTSHKATHRATERERTAVAPPNESVVERQRRQQKVGLTWLIIIFVMWILALIAGLITGSKTVLALGADAALFIAVIRLLRKEFP